MSSSRHFHICTRCGNCCRWPGIVRLKNVEIDRIADFMGLSVDEFTSRYTDLTPDRRGLTLTDREDGACVFLEGDNRCRINPVKPDQCRGFPDRWSFDGYEQVCPAIKIRYRMRQVTHTGTQLNNTALAGRPDPYHVTPDPPLSEADPMPAKPDFYYRQSAALPYRWNDGELDILLITTLKKRHWILPKGIVEPGFTPWDSAAYEAREEAGVQGVIDQESLGEYETRKWGGTCRVQVFPLRVEEVLDEWPEQELRDRQWVPIAQAIEMVTTPGLDTIIRQAAARLVGA